MLKSLLGLATLATTLLVVSPAAEADSDCEIAKWRECSHLMFIDPEKAEEFGVGGLRKLSGLVFDAEIYKTIEFAQLDIPAGSTLRNWHYHEFDVLALPIQGVMRFWWLDKVTGEMDSIVWDSDRRIYVLMPRGVPHFVDLRASATNMIAAEFLMSEHEWTAEDFVKHRIHVDHPIPPEVPYR